MSDQFRVGSIAPPLTAKPRPFKIKRRLPLTLHFVFWILIAGVVVSLVSLTIGIVGYNWTKALADGVRTVVRNGRTEHITAGEVIGGLVLVWALVLINELVQLALAILVRRGFNWARVLLTIYLALGLVISLSRFTFSPLGALGLVVGIACLVLVWLPASNRYFREVKADRKAHRSRQLG